MAKRPNILLVGIDSLLSTHMSCYGYDRLTTPHMDKFAEGGVLFENTFSPNVPTTPGYACMLTGMDIVPTLCDFAGVESPPDVRGKSLRPLLEGTPGSWRDSIVTEMPGNRARLVRTERYKYISYVADPVDLLFDMREDPGETRNLFDSGRHGDVIARLAERIHQWQRNTRDTVELSSFVSR